MVAASELAFAHNIYDKLPANTFEVKWAWDPVILFFLGMTVMYIRGLRSFKDPLPIKKWQVASFFIGMIILIAAMIPPIDPLSDQLFFVHMIQHLMISSLGIPLILFGVPFFIVLRGMPPWFKKNIYIPLLKVKPLNAAFDGLSKPLIALIVYQSNYWFWHIPRFYNLALLNDWFHLLQHACFAFSAMMLWRNIIDPHPIKAPLSLPARILYIGSVMASGVILSAFLTFSDNVLYAYQGRPLPGWWVWNHLEDQRLGGLIMWVPGEFLNLLAMTAIFFVWAHREQSKDKELQSQLVSSSSASACDDAGVLIGDAQPQPVV